jgi:uncharacterized membrane protein YbhN (UPF0104 family)
MGKGIDDYEEMAMDEMTPLLYSEPPRWYSNAICLGAIVLPVCCCCCVVVAILLVLLVFLFPTIPTVEYNHTTLSTFQVHPTGINLVCSVCERVCVCNRESRRELRHHRHNSGCNNTEHRTGNENRALMVVIFAIDTLHRCTLISTIRTTSTWLPTTSK